MRPVWLALIAVLLLAAPAAGQTSPELTEQEQLVIELNNELERLINDLQAALESKVACQAQFNVLTRGYNSLRGAGLRTRSTPAREGFTFDWTIRDGQRVGLVPDEQPEESEQP